jgi:hypothetical protein
MQWFSGICPSQLAADNCILNCILQERSCYYLSFQEFIDLLLSLTYFTGSLCCGEIEIILYMPVMSHVCRVVTNEEPQL